MTSSSGSLRGIAAGSDSGDCHSSWPGVDVDGQFDTHAVHLRGESQAPDQLAVGRVAGRRGRIHRHARTPPRTGRGPHRCEGSSGEHRRRLAPDECTERSSLTRTLLSRGRGHDVKSRTIGRIGRRGTHPDYWLTRACNAIHPFAADTTQRPGLAPSRARNPNAKRSQSDE